jgi:serine/threonine protein kinase/Tfp pilus assembly protein PilF
MALAPGTRLGPYVLDSLIGTGGMGEVYRAHDSRLNRTVAIKVLAPEVATPDRIERFEQEARAASALNHPNILTIHDVGRERETAYFAMEWVDGQTLREILREGPIPLRRSTHLAHQIAEGLAKAHAALIVHRDLKPENVMVTRDGLAKIVDFGLAKLASIPSATAPSNNDPTISNLAGTAPGIVMGTVGYMSPEQASGRPVDYRSDQFALGLLIYELVTRTRPFERPTTAQSLAATIEAEPTPIEVLNADVPPHLATVVARCLAKDPAERYESTRDLARDLKSILDSGSRSAATVPQPPRPGRSRYLAAIAAVVLIVSAGAAAWVWRGASTPTTPTERDRPLVAVRSFRSLSADPQQGYFAAGMTDEIRGQLSQVASLRLLSRNALDAYKEGESSRMVRELGIRNLVDGSVRVDGNRVRISAELVDASTNETLWSDSYDRELSDILAVQSDVALQITRALDANLSPHEQKRVELRPTSNVEAYKLYLQSQQTGALTNRARNLEAMELLRQALALDPRFAVAQARLAYRLVFMGYYDDPAFIDNGIAEAQAALAADPDLPYAYFTLGTAYSMKGMGAQARQAFLRALELDPNHVSAMNNFSIHEAMFGRLDESLYWGRRGFELSGKAGNDYYHVAVPLVNIRDDDGARRWLMDAERRFPDFHRVHSMIVLLDILQGHAERAVARSDALRTRLPHDEEAKFLRADVAFLTNSTDLEKAHEVLMERAASSSLYVRLTVRVRSAYALQKRGDTVRANQLLAEAERIAREKVHRGDQNPALRAELAAVSVLRGDQAGALDWLSQAYDSGYRDYGFLELDPILAALGSNARFREVLDRMKKDVDAQRARARDRGLLDIDGLLAPRQ